MSTEATQPIAGKSEATAYPRAQATLRKRQTSIAPFRISNYEQEQGPPQHQAELFYLQKQIQAQTQMVFILEDGEQIEGCIEWYDRNSLKIRGRHKTLLYKSAIKYMYKLGDAGQ
jgi:sRNA-binding regulator protein Hfq